MNFVCQNTTTCICIDEVGAEQDIVLHTAVCTLEGSWEPNLEDFCSNRLQSMHTNNVISQYDSIFNFQVPVMLLNRAVTSV